jgi:hypothetical protein
MTDVKRPRGRHRNENAKATLASLQQEITDMKAQHSTDSKKLFDLLYELGEKTSLALLGKAAPE